MTTSTESPYHNSRARVLTAYRRNREAGMPCARAMEKVLTDIHGYLSGEGPNNGRLIAELEWDRAHARRYLGMIDMRWTP